MDRKQLSSNVLMIRPFAFGYNPETAETNAFQEEPEQTDPLDIRAKALVEFNGMVERLQSVGIGVTVVDDSPEPVKIDAVFPNNWISTHADGTVVTYPMLSPIRRAERRNAVIDELAGHFRIERRLSLADLEEQGQFLEGTGSLVLDRPFRLAYACLSPRTHSDALKTFCRLMNFRPVAFEAVDRNGQPIYHTNVMMNVGEEFAVVCLDSIRKVDERRKVRQALVSTGKEIVEIDYAQLEAFAGNMLQLENATGDPVLVMSQQAYGSLRSDQIQALKQYAQILPVSLDSIERYGGGSARCMLAEIFLPVKD